jgi:hypothetical protein
VESDHNYDKGSCLATVTLTAGQSVFVQREDDNNASIIEGNGISSFSGFLLYPQ